MIKRPKAGQYIRVKTDWSDYLSVAANHLTRQFVHEGIVVDSSDQDPGNTFRLQTTASYHSVRIIEIARVIELQEIEEGSELHSVELTVAVSDSQEFQVTGSKGDIYVVTRNGSTFSCTCVAGSFGRLCKHVIGIQKQLTEAAGS